MKMAKKSSLFFIALCLVVAFSSAALAGAPYTAVKVKNISAQEMKARYAGVEPIPMPLPRLERQEANSPKIATHTGTPMKSFMSPANMPDGSYLGQLTGGEIATRIGPCPASDYYHFFDTDYYSFPAMAVGKLFFTGIDGLRYMCSGSVISENLVLTAGHCVMTSGWLHSDFEFNPGYYYGVRPYGAWSVNTIVYYNAWAEYEDFRYDVSFMILNPNYGAYVGNYVGWLGVAAGLDPTYQYWDERGYPYNLADGEALSSVTSAFGTYDYWGGYPSNPTIGVGSNMLGGCSGGPWIYYYDGYGYMANGVNSYGYTDCNYTMFSPYFNTDIWDGYQYALTLQ